MKKAIGLTLAVKGAPFTNPHEAVTPYPQCVNIFPKAPPEPEKDGSEAPLAERHYCADDLKRLERPSESSAEGSNTPSTPAQDPSGRADDRGDRAPMTPTNEKFEKELQKRIEKATEDFIDYDMGDVAIWARNVGREDCKERMRALLDAKIAEFDKICVRCNFDGKECKTRGNCQNGVIFNVLRELRAGIEGMK